MLPEFYFPLGDGGILVKAYALFAALGAAVGLGIAFPLLRRRGLSALEAAGLLCFMAVSFLAGARLFNVLVNWAAYEELRTVFSLRLTGLSFYGGLLGALTALILWVRVHRRSPWALLDAFIIPAAAAFVLARMGCFLNGCCSGVPTESLWGVVFPASGGENSAASALLSFLGKKKQPVPRHPTQLYEASLALLGLIAVYWHRLRKQPPAGVSFLAYGSFFSAMRLLILPLRSLPYTQLMQSVLYPLFYLALIGVGCYLIHRRYDCNKCDKC